MTKSKTWEEEFDDKFLGTFGLAMLYQYTDKTHRLIATYEELKDFIASQIEKTRRETLQRAIELVPQEKKYLFHWMKFGDMDDTGFSEGLADSSDDAPEIADGHSAEFVWNECRKFMLENLKNELNK